MVVFGLSFEGFPHFPLKEGNDGYLIPDASVAELSECHKEALSQSVATAVEAESMGFEYIVHAEHHSELVTNNSPNPILTQTAIARETQEIRLLQMANILPWHEPVRLAEMLSMLDILSDGRVDVGVGGGSRDIATATLGQYWGGSSAHEPKNEKSFEEKFEILVKAWTEDLVSYHGEFHQVPPSYTEREISHDIAYFSDSVCEYDLHDYISKKKDTITLEGLPVIPQPEQEPHPQLWRPALSSSSSTWAARRGINVCTHLLSISQTNEVVDAYYTAAKDAEWPDRQTDYTGEAFNYGWDAQRNRGVGIIISMFNTEVADDGAIERWKRSFKRDEQQRRNDLSEPINVDEQIQERTAPLYGDAAELINGLAEVIEECALDDALIICNPHSVGLTHEERREQIRAFADDVMPYFRDDQYK
ncbi:flavin-dependent oxidoreductase, F420-dependent methylene-tetrahydromethanopterin reductase [Halogeometricum borinquense DSM 11551]|uniref:Flavin-dependent oxidoreductase, F420-dependent methylene-tetrahydromethanopterin reductase n=1 Tax=Halogeometricum borinquense (strain ATCC 700274 / DSM 11551 / JCM 10706 / KCTC 4070 / PR3) TaxID=469382 RepID=E4NU08_HALBP|nr:LLM class flavin-dependent oxidoreductase [Halogeometricum borinquense]ADQ68528.1 flavin-dependent oxidoreductase, F420-dependent methylene-tetrahydromethanopterin reductase [Halogeometricum borinquense DSM 11551]ELY25600.1 flavin-dependent oxidoreductase, F420-dependent methylene-tetrahydromethanopterin reductase [Halogeometricum borinquense DSM 11551]